MADDIRTIDVSGWTSSGLEYRAVPTGAALSDIRQSVDIEFSAVPVTSERVPGVVSGIPAGGFRGFQPRLRYDVTLRGLLELPQDALLGFGPAVDSATVFVDGKLYDRSVWISRSLLVPAAAPGALIRVLGWSASAADSVTVKLRAGSSSSEARTPVGIGLQPGNLRAWVSLPTRALPAIGVMPVSAALQLVLQPAASSWPEVSYVLPEGWRVVPGSTRVGTRRTADPKVEQDGAGRARLRWKFTGQKPAPMTVLVTTDPVLASGPDRVTVTPARTASDRAAERRSSLVKGPGVEIVAPADGTVLPGDRVYVGVKGEPGVPVMLYDGDRVIDSAAVRVDGMLDFIAVPLARGPHRLRARIINSSRHERWDSVAVHVTGLPARFEAPATIALAADGRSVVSALVRALDSWGIPVTQPAYVTVTAEGAEVIGTDADQSSVGTQLLSSATGRLDVALRPGHTVGAGRLHLQSGDARASIPLEIRPQVRALTVAGAGMVGAGASADAYGAVTARGRLDSRTSVTLTLDSRRLDAGRNVFGRANDPLEDSQYPILGDASHVNTRAASSSWFSARLERGFDWVSVGDVATNDFAPGLSLAGYRRAVNGIAGRLTTGPVTWSGFGSMTAQSLRQLQIRGAGVSGPYFLGSDVLPGTELLRLETRAIENPERAIVTQGLARYVDYEIDYAMGTVLFKRPVPAADALGNPVYLMATFEAASGGDRQLVAGGRAALDLRTFGAGRLDSLRLGVTAVNAEQVTAPYRLVGADVRALRLGGIDLGGEIAYAEQGDSNGMATGAKPAMGTATAP